MKPADLQHRRDRVARIQAKKPRAELVVEPTYRPNAAKREQFLELLADLLDEGC